MSVGRPKNLAVGLTRGYVYDFIVGHYAAHGVPPSIREIGAGTGLVSTGTVHYHVGQLVREGQLRKVRGMYVPVTRAA